MTSIYKQWTEGVNDNIKDIINGYLFEEQRILKKIIDKTFHRIQKSWFGQVFGNQSSPFLSCMDVWSISPELIDDVKVYISVKYAIKIFEKYRYGF